MTKLLQMLLIENFVLDRTSYKDIIIILDIKFNILQARCIFVYCLRYKVP